MCGRYSITAKAEKLAQRFKVEVGEKYSPRFNAAPTQLLPIITGENPDGFSLFYWGLVPQWSNNKSISSKFFNARAETLLEKAGYKNALRARRCLVPADGFYEWKNVNKKSKIPYRITLSDKEPFAFAGLWEEYENEENEMIHTFTIITTNANSAMLEINERMPVILSQESEEIWLNNESTLDELMNVLQPNVNIDFHTVSSQVNSVQVDRPDLIKPAPAIDQFGNYTLFN